MRFPSVPPLLALLCAFLGLTSLRAADDPGALFLQAYQAYKVGERLEAAGQSADAEKKYRDCASVLEQVRKKTPDYEPIVIEFRLKKSREGLARLRSAAETPPGESTPPLTSAAAAPPPKSSAPPAPRLPRLSVDYRLPVPGRPAPLVPPAAPSRALETESISADAVMERGAIAALKAANRDLNQQLTRERRLNEELRLKVLGSLAEMQSAQVEVDRTKVQNVELRGKLDQTHRSLDDLQRMNDRFSREKIATDQRIAGLEADLDASRADVEVAEEFNAELFVKLERAAEFIEASEKVRSQLLTERAESAKDAKEQSSLTAQLQAERDAALAKEKSRQKEIEETRQLTRENRELSAKLATAEDEVAAAARSREDWQKIQQGLRQEIESVNQTLARVRKQAASGDERIVDLEKQLADTAAASASVTGAMAEENALLKSLVARQISEQARRQQARKLVEEEIEKLELRSATLVDRLDALGAAETQLTPREKKLFERPVATAGGSLDFSLVIAKREPASDLPGEFEARAREANQLSQEGRLPETRAIYQALVRDAPRSHTAAVNLGITERMLGNYPEAITAFKRALDLKANDAFTLTNLGSSQFRAGDVASAIRTLQQAVGADGEDHLSRYFLALALHQSGDAEAARREVTRSLQLKPDYLPAVELESEMSKAATYPAAPIGATTR